MVVMAARICRHIVVVIVMMAMTRRRVINRSLLPVLAMAMLIDSDESLARAIAVILKDPT